MVTEDQVKEIMGQTPGLETAPELLLLAKAIEHVKPDNAAEIGCLYGLSSSVLMEAMGDRGELYSVDNFCVQGEDAKRFMTTITMPKYPRIHLIEADSKKAGYEFEEKLDFLFIDGNHQDEGILNDLKYWVPKVRSGGLVAFHDYFNNDFPAISRRVSESCSMWKTWGMVDSLLIMIVP